MQIVEVSVVVVEIPQVEPVAPYRSHLRTSSTTRSAIVRIDAEGGLTGWGEYNVNFLDVDAAQAEATARQWIGRDAWNVAAMQPQPPFDSRLRSGVEMALWDLRGKATGRPIAELLGGVIRSEIELAACMGIQSYERAGELARYYRDQGFGTLKTKAGADAAEDLAMVRGVRDAVGDSLKLRIDPNCAYSPREAAELAKELEPYRLEYLEQPITAEPLSDARWLREQTETPIALNESVVDPSSVWRILHAGAADFVLPDTHIAGGILPCVQIGALCSAAGVPAIMHCGHDLGLKTAAMLHVASACEAYSLANDSTYHGLADDVLAEPLSIERGRMRTPTGAGLGVEVDVEKIRRYAVV